MSNNTLFPLQEHFGLGVGKPLCSPVQREVFTDGATNGGSFDPFEEDSDLKEVRTKTSWQKLHERMLELNGSVTVN